jgi:hypothetical protein
VVRATDARVDDVLRDARRRWWSPASASAASPNRTVSLEDVFLEVGTA